MPLPGRAWIVLAALTVSAVEAQTSNRFTLEQALSAPYATDLTPAPAPGLYAWVEDTEGRHNLWIGGGTTLSHPLTHNTEDDAQDISALAWSPDSTQIAYTVGASSGADGKPANPAHLQHPTPVTVRVQGTAVVSTVRNLGEGRAPQFTTDGHSLLFVRAGQIWIADLGGSAPPHQLVFDRGSASQLTLSPDGSLLAFTSTRHLGSQGYSFLALFDMRTGTLTFPAPSTGSDFAPVFSPDSRYLAWLRKPFTEPAQYAANRTSPNPWSIQLMEVGGCAPPQPCTPAARTLYAPRPNAPGSVLPHPSTGDPRLFFLPDHRLVFSSEADGWNHLYLLDWENHQPPTLLTPGPFEVEDASMDRTGDRSSPLLYYAANDPAVDALDTDRRHLFRINFDKALPFPYLTPQPLTNGDGIETHPHGGLASFAGLYASVHEPMHPVITGADHIPRPLLLSSAPTSFPGARFITPTPVLLRTRDGLTLHAQLFLPPAPAPRPSASIPHRRPAIVFFHGGPHRQMLLGFPSLDYYSNAYAMNQYLASRGFLVLSVNYRCGIGYGLEFRQCLHAGGAGASEYNDVLAAAHYLRTRPDVDPKRIGAWGGSYGGYLTALALARNSNLFAAGVDFHGVHERLPDAAEPPAEAEGWLPTSTAVQARRRRLTHASSPMADIRRWRSPVLLIHGDNDPEVDYYQTPLLADALRARGVPVEELIFPDEVHGFLLHRDWLRAYEAAADFFERKLHPER